MAVTTKIRRRLDSEGRILGSVVEKTETQRATRTPRQIAASNANLAKWREQAATPDLSIETAVSAHRAALYKEMGSEPTATQLLLVEGMLKALATMLRCERRSQRSHISYEQTLELERVTTAKLKVLVRSSKALAEMRIADPDDSVNAELEQIEKEIHAARSEPKPS